MPWMVQEGWGEGRGPGESRIVVQHNQVKLSFFESPIHISKYTREQLGRKLHQRATSTSKIAFLLMPKRRSGAGEAIVPLMQDPQKLWRVYIINLPRRRRYFYTVPGRRNTGRVRLHSTVLFLQDPINCCVLTHTRLQLPNEVLQMEPARGR